MSLEFTFACWPLVLPFSLHFPISPVYAEPLSYYWPSWSSNSAPIPILIQHFLITLAKMTLYCLTVTFIKAFHGVLSFILLNIIYFKNNVKTGLFKCLITSSLKAMSLLLCVSHSIQSAASWLTNTDKNRWLFF